jgi:hypothetical protein
MKRLTLTCTAALALGTGACAQGIIDLDDSLNTNGVAIVYLGNYYTGTFGMEVWENNDTSAYLPGINDDGYYGLYWVLSSEGGWNLEATFTNQTMSQGTFELGPVLLPDVRPAGATVALALVVWAGSAPSVYEATGDVGAIAFVNPTLTPPSAGQAPATPPALSGWTGGDLVVSPLWGWDHVQLQVDIVPPAAVSAGAKWQVNGGPWQDSGTTVILPYCPPCTNVVSFSPVSGFATPGNLYIFIANYQTATLTGTYQRTAAPAPPVWQSIVLQNGVAALTWSGNVGQSYQVQFTTNLAQGAWTTVGVPIAATNSTMTTTDRLGQDAQRFYRVLLVP